MGGNNENESKQTSLKSNNFYIKWKINLIYYWGYLQKKIMLIQFRTSEMNGTMADMTPKHFYFDLSHKNIKKK